MTIPESPPPAVSLRGLRKVFGRFVAVDDIELDIPRGSFFGLVGPNGAGKTTTIMMSTGLLRPNAGTALIEGIDIWWEAPKAKAVIGVLPEDLPLFDRLTGSELLMFTGLIRRLPPQMVKDRSESLLRFLDLADSQGKLIVDYSHGMRKKIALAAALLHNPSVLFLDEPFEGIDPGASRGIREALENYVASGGTVIFSSHVMEVVERLCDRLAIINHGRIVASGPIDELRGEGTLEDAFVQMVGAARNDADLLEWLRPSSG